MIDSTIIFFIKNIFFISILLWFITMLGNFFFSKYEYINQNDFYECGFKTTTDINFNLNFSFFISAIFLILYDIELMILIPFLFNVDIKNYTSFSIFMFFIFIILTTIILDVIYETVEWNF